MKILIVVPRYELTTKPSYFYWYPFGLGYISAVLKKEGYTVDCLNLNHYEGKSQDILKDKLDSTKYSYVCTGNHVVHYYEARIILNTARKHPTKPITIFGGTMITTEPEIIFNDLCPTFGVIGEGERTIVELINCIENKKNPENVPGLIYKQKNKLIITQKRDVIMDLDSLPLPDFEGLEFEKKLNNVKNHFGYELSIFDKPRVYPLLASRACPFQCTFCYHEPVYRKRSIKNIMKELTTNVKKYKINIITIFDECFSLDKNRLFEFCEAMKQLISDIDWDLRWSCQLIVNTVDGEILRVMKDAGCYLVGYGFESYSHIVLKSMKKAITPERINNALTETFNANLIIRACFLFGDIAETKETAQITLNYWKNNCKGQVSLTMVQPYPGTYIYQHCINKGLIKDKLDFIKKIGFVHEKAAVNMTNYMTDEEIGELEKEMNTHIGRYSNFVTPLRKKRIGKKTYSFTVKCPFCKKIIKYGNFYVKHPLYYGGEVACKNCYKTFYLSGIIYMTGFKYYGIIKNPFNKLKRVVNAVRKNIIKGS